MTHFNILEATQGPSIPEGDVSNQEDPSSFLGHVLHQIMVVEPRGHHVANALFNIFIEEARSIQKDRVLTHHNLFYPRRKGNRETSMSSNFSPGS